MPLQERYGLFVGGEWVEPRSGEYFATISPSDEEPLAEVAQAGPEDVELAVAAAREAFAALGEAAGQRAREVPVPDRAHPPGARARVRRARVAERRQADQGVARRRPAARRGALLLLRGLGGQARVRVPEPAGRSRVGVAGQIIPWNFPLLMLAWKIAPALADREHGRAEAGRDDAADRAALLRRAAAGRAAAGRGQHRHRRRPHRRRARRRRRRQDRVHRLDRGRQGDPAPARRHGQEADARARRQGREHRLRRRRARPGGRGDRQRDLLQPGPRLLRRLAALRAGVDRRAGRSTS